MKKILPIITLFALLGSVANIFAQENEQLLRLKSGDYQLSENVKSFIDQPNFEPDELINGTYYRIIQFSQTPTQSVKIQLKNSGIQLLEFLPERAFYAAIDENADLTVLESTKAISVVEVKRDYKLNKILINKKYPEWAYLSDNSLGINAVFHANIEDAYIQSLFENLGIKIVEGIHQNIASIEVPLDQLEKLYADPAFYYFETFDQPGEPEDYQDVANHRTNWLNNPVGTGVGYDGTGVSVMLQDDGPIGPHIDYEGRVDMNTSNDNGDHGDHCAGILMGAGNLDPEGVGNAPGADLYVYSSGNGNFDLVPLLHDIEGVVITSKSYGNGQNAGYTSLARKLDEQCYENYDLIHVFSAGNSGTSDFGYGAGAGWGNITGGHKQGKNVLAVGNLSVTDALSNSSSRGPADDGRIKPDICAVGSNVYSTVDPNTYDIKSGTSMACPGVAGSLAVLYEAYKNLFGGQNPDNALINGAVLNTATDLGNPGPDFKYGWGRINLRRAYELIESERYEASEITQGIVNQHSIEVPQNCKRLRVMVYWTDYPGSPAASKALVNDINMSMIGPDATAYLPLVLDPTPNAGILDMDAQPGVDDLNNVEQIVIENPVAGTYTINLEGFDIPQGPQQYYLVYEPIVEDLVLTYPIGGESVNNGESELIRWDALGEDQTFRIEYSADGGITWETINNTLPGDWRAFPWTPPAALVTGKGKIRITRGTDVVESELFSVIDPPNNLNVEWACPDAFNFSWDPVDGAVAYQVYLLGDKYMDSAGYTTTTNATVYASSLETQWVSVAAIGPDNAISKRAYAIEKTPGTFGCTLDPPVAQFTAYCNETAPGTCVQFEDVSTNAGQGAAWEWYFPGGTPETSIYPNPVVCYNQEGYYDVQLIVKNGVGEDVVYSTNYVVIRPAEALPFKEDFESGVISPEWTIENQGSTVNWMIDPNTSAYRSGTNSIVFNHFANDSVGSTASFITQQIHLEQEGVFYELNFDVAYAGLGDSLKVYVTQDCGVTKSLIYSNGGVAMQTTTEAASLFVPTSEQWRNEFAPMLNFTGDQAVSFIFETYSANGNALYVDNINVRVSEENFSGDEINVFPNPFTDELNIAGLVEGESTTLRIVDANGKVVMDKVFNAPGGTIILSTSHLADGMYVIKITSESKTHKEKLIKGN